MYCIFPLCLSFCPIHLLFIQKTFHIYRLWCQKRQKAVNDSFIFIPHIHAYGKKKKQEKEKSLTLKYTNIWIFKSREKVVTSSP